VHVKNATGHIRAAGGVQREHGVGVAAVVGAAPNGEYCHSASRRLRNTIISPYPGASVASPDLAAARISPKWAVRMHGKGIVACDLAQPAEPPEVIAV